MSGLFAKLSGGALFLLLFAVLAVLAWRTIPTTVAAVEPPQAAHDFAQAWQDGDLDRVSFDPASAPDVGEADPKLVTENVLTMVREISPVDLDHPIAVIPVGEPREQKVDQGELLAGDLVQPLEVSWDLGHQRRWIYRTELPVRETEGRQRVLWRPSVVHPGPGPGPRTALESAAPRAGTNPGRHPFRRPGHPRPDPGRRHPDGHRGAGQGVPRTGPTR